MHLTQSNPSLLFLLQADGRDVNLSLIYPCFLGSRMLGSTTFPWLSGVGSFIHNEDYLSFAFAVAGLSLTVVAYDYQVQISSNRSHLVYFRCTM